MLHAGNLDGVLDGTHAVDAGRNVDVGACRGVFLKFEQEPGCQALVDAQRRVPVEQRQGYDLVVVARARAVGAPYRTLDTAFLRACESLELLL